MIPFLPPLVLVLALSFSSRAEPVQRSGIYPSLAFFNQEGECGTGAVVPWADRLWVITYAPHKPSGSSDKLYEITPDLRQIVRPESIGGTPANRMIHPESQQLFIGPYAIGADRAVRTIPYSVMFGRPTGNARHLFDAAGKIYYATMEEGLYEVDVKTLAVTELWGDEAKKNSPRKAGLPGYHGKGLYSGQGVLVYANNGEYGSEAKRRPDVPSGVLAEWDGKAEAWTIVRRNQFTEVTGSGGIQGNAQPATDPIWTIGWDHLSLLLGVREADRGWSFFRLPKASHSYDGAHGWNTEWPRIREIGEDDLLMTMHGMFWRFPRTFTSAQRVGLAPRSTYLKVIGDFCRWGDRLVFGCDDTAASEFLNKRKAKGTIAAPQSQSNLWFLDPDEVDRLGPVAARGGVWLEQDVTAGQASDAFLLNGFARSWLHLHHRGTQPARLILELDAGSGTPARRLLTLPPGYTGIDLSAESAAWITLRAEDSLTRITAWYSLSNPDDRSADAAPLFAGLAPADATALTGGLVRARSGDKRTLSFAAQRGDAQGRAEVGYYELDAELRLRRVEDAEAHTFTREKTSIPTGSLTLDAASVIYTDDAGRRWRLPRGDAALDRESPLGPHRVCREVATERDLFHAHGSFFELPAENAGGFAKVRAVATHNRRLHDFCSFRGLFVLSGLAADAAASGNPHVIVSDDAQAALWVGAIDDVWKLGKPRGLGGPWKDSAVAPAQPSEPYLLNGYDRRTLALSHDANQPVEFLLELDLTGSGNWVQTQSFTVAPGATLRYAFPAASHAHWLRLIAGTACRATATLTYE
jgi:hypothetical protein